MERLLEKNHSRTHHDTQRKHRSQNLFERFPFRPVDRGLIKTLQFKKDGAEKHHHDREPIIILQRIDPFRHRDRDRAMETQAVGGEQRNREQQRIDYLEDLGV